MADRSDIWGGRSPQGYSNADRGVRRRHDQQRLLVELELDDSLYQGTLRAGIEHGECYKSANPPPRRTQNAADSDKGRHYDQDGNKVESRSKTPRGSASKLLTGRQVQLQAKRLSSPYKLKQQVLGTRNEPENTAHQRYYQRRSPHKAGSNGARLGPSQASSSQLVIESIRQNVHLREQVLAHLQQELLGVLPLHRATYVEKNVPQRVVKLLNKMRSLSLAVVEAVVYLSNEFGSADRARKSAADDVLEQEFYRYLLKMSSSDMDFLACSPPLQRFFEDFEVNLTRNPFVDGLSLDSSEVLLCSCHHNASSGALFCSASFSSSSLFRLMSVKLEEFAKQTQRYLPGWQVLPVVRVAAALLHLVDLETRFNAVRLLPRYLQPSTQFSDSYVQPRYNNASAEPVNGTASFNPRPPDPNDQNLARSEIPVIEAWSWSPTATTNKSFDSIPISTSLPAVSRDSVLVTMARDSTQQKKGECRSPLPLNSAWVEPTNIVKSNAGSVEGHGGVLPLSPDPTAEVKIPSQDMLLERSASKKKSKVTVNRDLCTAVDVAVQAAEKTPHVAAVFEKETSTDFQTARCQSTEQTRDEAIQADGQISHRTVEELKQPSSTRSSVFSSWSDEIFSGKSMTATPPKSNERVSARTSEDALNLDEDMEIFPDIGPESLSCEEQPIPSELLDKQLIYSHDAEVSVADTTDNTPDCEIPTGNECDDDEYECDFEYSSNDAVSSIAQALKMLPQLSPFSSERLNITDASTPDETTTRDIVTESDSNRSRASNSNLLDDDILSGFSNTARSTQSISSGWEAMTTLTSDSEDIHGIYIPQLNLAEIQDEDGSVTNDCEMKSEPQSPDDAFSYTSNEAISNIAKALSLLPQVPDAVDEPLDIQYDLISDRSFIPTDRSFDEMELPTEEVWDSPDSPIPAAIEHTPTMTSIRSHHNQIVQENEQEDTLGLSKIFSLCKDIQVAAYDLSHWTSQREVESHVQSVSLSMGYPMSPVAKANVDNAPRYLERELKMLRRNFTTWKEACIERKRARRFVRRLAAKRTIRKFMQYQYQLRVNAREEEVRRTRCAAASHLQRNWRVYCHNKKVVSRKADFRRVHMAFHRALFFVDISRRRYVREYSKEWIVRWWRHQRARIRKEKHRQDKINRERERRTRAMKEINRFLKEILLRRRLKVAQELSKNILFKEQLKWTKAKREMEKSMKLNAKHRRELVADMNDQLADLDRRWKSSEQEKLELLSHQERVMQQQQHLFERRRRDHAALKIQMFLKVCHLHRRLQQVESEKRKFEVKLREEKRAKDRLDVDAQQRVGKTRTQIRVLERKLGRLSEQISKTEVHHRNEVAVREAREKYIRKRAAHKTIKSFIDVQVLSKRADNVRQQLLREQVQVRAEKMELELMSEQDRVEHHRAAASIALNLTQRLSQLEQQSEALLLAKNKLEAEKEHEVHQAALLLEQTRVDSSMHQIASWVSKQMQVSKFKKQQAAIQASAAHDLEELKRKQRKELEGRMREVTSVKVTSLVHHSVGQHRHNREVAIARMKEQEQAVRDKAIAEQTRMQLVQIIIEVKLFSEREASRSIQQALHDMTQLQATLTRKFNRLKNLRDIQVARKIQRVCRLWMHQQRIKRVVMMALAQFEESKQRQALARRTQAWWRKWALSQRQRRDQEKAFHNHLEEIKRRALVRKIQRTWKRWCLRRLQERERIRVERVQLVSAFRIQTEWRKWLKRQREKAERVRIARETSAQLIQQGWKRWQQQRENAERLRVAQETSAQLIQQGWKRWQQAQEEKQRREDSARRLQRSWRRWRQWKRLREFSAVQIQQRYQKWKVGQKAKLEAERVRKVQMLAAIIIQRKWHWRQQKQFEEKERERQLCIQQMSLSTIQTACYKWWQKQQKQRAAKQMVAVNRIQGVWRRWKWLKDKRLLYKLQAESADRIQQSWRQWHLRRQAKAKIDQLKWEKQEHASAMLIQHSWTKYREWKKVNEEQQQVCGAERIQRNWRQHHDHQIAKQDRKRIKDAMTASAIKLQRSWQNWYQNQCKLNEQARLKQEVEQQAFAAYVIQVNWRRALQLREKLEEEKCRLLQHSCASKIQKNWHNNRLLQKEREQLQVDLLRQRSAIVVQRVWRRCKSKMENERMQQEYTLNAFKIQAFWRNGQQRKKVSREKERVLQTQNASSIKIQRNWNRRRHRHKMEREHTVHIQHVSALKIQTFWLQWHHRQQEELELERIRQEQDASSLKIQRNWAISQHRRRVSHERVRHRENMSALKIQKHWRRWRNLRRQNRVSKNALACQKPTSNNAPHVLENKRLQQDENERQQKFEEMKYRYSSRRILRAMKRYHIINLLQANAATKIGAAWRGKMCREMFAEAIEAKIKEDARIYLLKVSVFATKVQVCWRRWHVGFRRTKRSVVKAAEQRLIEEQKAQQKRRISAVLLSYAAHLKENAAEDKGNDIQDSSDNDNESDRDEELGDDVDELREKAGQTSDGVEAAARDESESSAKEEKDKEAALTRAMVEGAVHDWSHRELPHILTHSVNRILFCSDAAVVLQRFVRNCQRRHQLHFYFRRSFSNTAMDGKEAKEEHFHLYFKRARAWMERVRHKASGLTESTVQLLSPLRLRFNGPMTRKLLQLLEPEEVYSTSEREHIFQELAADALPIYRSRICVESNRNVKPELRYLEVGETELPRCIALMRQLGKLHAQIRREQILEIDTQVATTSPIASAPSSPVKVTIFTAVESASIEDAIFLQKRGAELGAIDPKTQRNALHMLAFSTENYRSRAEMMEFLLQSGANLDVNAIDHHGDTPLMLFASLGHLEFMQKLLKHGADIQLTNKKGQNVLHRACEKDQVEVCGFLQQLMMKDSISENVVEVESFQVASSTLSLHTPESTGQYPLHVLVEKGFLECAKQVLVPTEANYDWNRMLQAQGNAQRRTALHLAVLTHDAGMTTFLLTPGAGANVNAFDDLRRTPLHYAVESPAALSIISQLVQHGGDFNLADERGDTPLHWAAFSGRAGVLQHLLSLGADPRLVNSDWETPAQIAAAYGQLDCMRLLVQAQRRFDASRKGETPSEQVKPFIRPASEKTVLERLEEAQNYVQQKISAAQSYRKAEDTANEAADDDSMRVEQSRRDSRGEYWAELHQDVQLVEESGQFSSEDEDFFDDD